MKRSRVLLFLAVIVGALCLLFSCDPKVEDIQYRVGNKGPTGGYIFYDCDADNDSGNADGLISTECGWRFLEAAPADLRIVDGIPTIDSSVSGYSSASYYFRYGYYRISESESNLYVNGTASYNLSDCTGETVGTGRRNTQLLVGAMGDETYSDYSGSNKTAEYAAKMCDDLTYIVKGVTYSDWFLPSKDELNQMYIKLYKASLGGLDASYWSSSEGDSGFNAWRQIFDNSLGTGGIQDDYGRGNYNHIRPVRAF